MIKSSTCFCDIAAPAGFCAGAPANERADTAAASIAASAAPARARFAIDPPPWRSSPRQPRRQVVISAHIAQPEIPPLVEISEPLVIDPEQAEQCGVEIVNVHL